MTTRDRGRCGAPSSAARQPVPHLVRASLAVALVAAACGAKPAPSGAWRENARQVITQLRADIASVETVGPTERDARAQLANVSDLFGLLLAYTDLSGCSAMVQSTGAPPRVARQLARPCGKLEHAATLFAQANTHHDPTALVAATKAAGRALPDLVKASEVTSP